MVTTGIITALDREIAYLQQVRALLAGTGTQQSEDGSHRTNLAMARSASLQPGLRRRRGHEPSQESPLDEAVLN